MGCTRFLGWIVLVGARGFPRRRSVNSTAALRLPFLLELGYGIAVGSGVTGSLVEMTVGVVSLRATTPWGVWTSCVSGAPLGWTYV